MHEVDANVRNFLDRFSQWAKAQPDIDAVALVGSYAREAGDEESDVDLIILTNRSELYLDDASWASTFGEVTETAIENWGRAQSLRVFYKDKLEIEYCFAHPEWAESPVDPGTRQVVSDGMKILFDPRGILARLQREVCAT